MARAVPGMVAFTDHPNLCICYDHIKERHLFCEGRGCGLRLSRVSGEEFFGNRLSPPSFNCEGKALCWKCAIGDAVKKRHVGGGFFEVIVSDGWQEAIETALGGKLRDG